ncbi:hypothetical protein WJX74_008114 [Apatococcus lobatus]|uniref:Uncharacterized protein n=1 Tax=Apatococcus lobatus TaxID=904363 RepID=A0AAW1RQ87_9CHLO
MTAVLKTGSFRACTALRDFVPGGYWPGEELFLSMPGWQREMLIDPRTDWTAQMKLVALRAAVHASWSDPSRPMPASQQQPVWFGRYDQKLAYRPLELLLPTKPTVRHKNRQHKGHIGVSDQHPECRPLHSLSSDPAPAAASLAANFHSSSSQKLAAWVQSQLHADLLQMPQVQAVTSLLWPLMGSSLWLLELWAFAAGPHQDEIGLTASCWLLDA